MNCYPLTVMNRLHTENLKIYGLKTNLRRLFMFFSYEGMLQLLPSPTLLLLYIFFLCVQTVVYVDSNGWRSYMS
jgi:hypothetical protein